MLKAMSRISLLIPLFLVCTGCKGSSSTTPPAPVEPANTRQASNVPKSAPVAKEPAPVAKKATPVAKKEPEPLPKIIATPMPTKGNAPKVLALGQTFDAAGLKVTVTKVEEMTKAQVEKAMLPETPPVRDDRYLLVHVTLENTSGEEMLISSGLHMGLKVESGGEASPSIYGLVASKGKQLDGMIQPKEKWVGISAWQMPKAAKGFKWVFKSSGQEEIVIFDLKL